MTPRRATSVASSKRWLVPHGVVAAGFVALAVLWTMPLSLHLSTHLPGAAIGDNAVFLWNFWWMRHALATHTGFFHTSYLFAPAGTSLTFHTHTALPALVGATLLGGLPLVTASSSTTPAAARIQYANQRVNGAYLVMQGDGNVVVYDLSSVARWSSWFSWF